MKKTASWMLVIGMAAATACAESEELFRKWDKNKDGLISREEFFAMVESQFALKGQEDYKKEAALRFENRDTNKDGVLSLEEFMSTPGMKKIVG